MTHAIHAIGYGHERRSAVWLRAAVAGAIAAAVNALVFLLARTADLIPDSVAVSSPAGEGALTIGPVVAMSIVPAIVAAIVYLLARRVSARPARVFRIAGGILLVLSLLMPFGIPDVPLGMALTLDLMHLVAGVAILVLIPAAGERG